jgi:hypothetical protein
MSSPQPDGQSHHPAADAPSRPDAEVMERVLQETLSAANLDQPVDEAEMDVFRRVVRRHAGQPLSLDPIVTELVESILLYRFGESMRLSSDWPEMPRTIAETVWDSPHSHQRIQRLWDRLSEAAL